MISVLLQRLGWIGVIAAPLGTVLAFDSILPPSVLAQITSDGTLSTTVTSSDNRNFVIDGGEGCCLQRGQRGSNNLFHSFDEFSIPANGSAVFRHPADIDIIFNRVTGTQISKINGLLQSGESADIFLLNPNGIIFGPNAELDIGGSFISTTAATIVFEDGVEFDTAGTSPLLSITAPVGLQFGAQSGRILGRGNEPSRLSRTDDFLLQPLSRDQNRSHIQVPSGHTLAFLGNGVTFRGSNLVAENGHLALGSLQSGRVTLKQQDDIWRFTYDGVNEWSDIQLRSQSALDVSGINSHGIQLVGQELQLIDGSLAFIQSLGDANQADIEVTASDRLLVSGMNPTGTVPSGIRNELINLSALSGTVSGGDIRITASDVVIQDGGELVLPNYSAQTSGTLSVSVNGAITVDGVYSLDSTRFSRLGIANFADGQGGDVRLSGTQLFLTNGGIMSSITSGRGDGGNVYIDMSDSVDVAGLGPVSDEGLQAASSLDASTIGEGDAGSIILRTSSLLIDDGNITSVTLSSGDAGSIDVDAESIDVITNQSRSLAEITSAAKANNVVQIGLGLPRIPTGNAGSLSIRTSRLNLMNNARIAVENQGMGDAGSVDIEGDVILLQNRSRISAATVAGDSGNLNVTVHDALVLQDNSFLSATAGDMADDTGNGGNINIAGPAIVGVNNSDIRANAFQGDGGNISVATLGLYGFELQDQLSAGNDITASSQFGLQGTITIQNPEVDPSSQVVELPNLLVDIEQLVDAGCSLDDGQFILAGRGGLPSSPQDLMDGNRPWVDLRDLSAFLNNPSDPVASSPAAQPAILESPQEATGMAIAPNGSFQLIASQAQNAVISHATCMSQANGL